MLSVSTSYLIMVCDPPQVALPTTYNVVPPVVTTFAPTLHAALESMFIAFHVAVAHSKEYTLPPQP